jgi:hypothetical protein
MISDFCGTSSDVMQCVKLVGEADGARSGGHLHLDDETNSNKVYVIYCTKTKCYGIGTCYCCESLNGEPCYETIQECRRNCPVCNPHCKPPTLPLAGVTTSKSASRSLGINSRPPVVYKKLSTGSWTLDRNWASMCKKWNILVSLQVGIIRTVHPKFEGFIKNSFPSFVCFPFHFNHKWDVLGHITLEPTIMHFFSSLIWLF